MLISSLLSLIHATKLFPMIDHPDSRHPLRDERLRILTEKCRHNLQNLHCINISPDRNKDIDKNAGSEVAWLGDLKKHHCREPFDDQVTRLYGCTHDQIIYSYTDSKFSKWKLYLMRLMLFPNLLVIPQLDSRACLRRWSVLFAISVARYPVLRISESYFNCPRNYSVLHHDQFAMYLPQCTCG